MKVYQVIKHEYNSDDGHYFWEPESDYVFEHEIDAIKRRDSLNLAELARYEFHVHQEIARRIVEWETAGKPKRVMVKGGWRGDYLSPHCTDGIEDYKSKNLFTGDPTDIDAVVRFVNRYNCLTYFTVDTLGVLR